MSATSDIASRAQPALGTAFTNANEAASQSRHCPNAELAQAKVHVLIVEDNPDTAETLRVLLQLSGYHVAVAYNGSAGVEVARQFRPHIVLSDLGLPGIDGFEVARQLRRSPETATATLIAVTGYGQEEDRRKSRQAGFDYHLVKPVDPNELERLLQSVAP